MRRTGLGGCLISTELPEDLSPTKPPMASRIRPQACSAPSSTEASASGRWLPIKSLDAVDQLEANAAVAAGDERSLAVASGANAPESVVGDRPIGHDFDASESCRSARSADRSGPSRTRRGDRSG